jgi:hypothetical protein
MGSPHARLLFPQFGLALSLEWPKLAKLPGGIKVHQFSSSRKALTNQERSRSLDDSKVGRPCMTDFPKKRKDEQGGRVTSH